jgi:hypothetical protein
MAEGPVFIILRMIAYLIQSAMDTLLGILRLLWELISSLALVSAVGGTLGVLLAVVIFAVVGFLIARFFLGSMKSIIVLLGAGLLILLFILYGLASLV